jgi:CheY-like chemotaxis protein
MLILKRTGDADEARSAGSEGPPILAVDDEESNLLLLRQILERDGYMNFETTTEPSRAAGTHERPYKRGWPAREALAEIVPQAGRQFDPDVLQAFSRLDHPRLLSHVKAWEPPTRRRLTRSRAQVRAHV